MVFAFNCANVFATTGTGQNTITDGTGNNAVDASRGTALFNIVNGSAGGSLYIAGFSAADHIHLGGYAADEVSHALATATAFQGSEVLHLRDGTTLGFGGVAGLTTSAFV